MSWRARPICMRCQRVIHGPGTGAVGPVPSMFKRIGPGARLAPNEDMVEYAMERAARCALCHEKASPYNHMRLWADEDEPDEGLEFQ